MDNINLIDINKIFIKDNNEKYNNIQFGNINYYCNDNPLLLALSNITLKYNLIYSYNSDLHLNNKYDKNRFLTHIIINDYPFLDKLKEIDEHISKCIINKYKLLNNKELNYDGLVKTKYKTNDLYLAIKIPIKNKKEYNKNSIIDCNVKYKDNLFNKYKITKLNNLNLIIDNVNLDFFEKIKKNSKINLIIEIKKYWIIKNNFRYGLQINLKEITILNIPNNIKNKDNNIENNDIENN